jgi:hypothetical protein
MYWRDERSGKLVAAVHAYLAFRCKKGPCPDPRQIELLARYLQYVIDAPCWCATEELQQLRDRARHLQTCDGIAAWIHDALDIGIDPL